MCVTASYRAGKEVLIKSIRLLVPCHLWLIISLICFIIFTGNGNSCSATTGSWAMHRRSYGAVLEVPAQGWCLTKEKRGKRFTFWDNSMTTSKIPLFFKGVKCSLRKFLTAEMQGAKMCLLMPHCVVSTSPSASAPSLLCPRLCPWPFQQPVCRYLSPAHPNFDPVPFIITHTPWPRMWGRN